MTEMPAPGPAPEPSVWEEIAIALFTFGTTLLTHRRRVVRWTLGGGVIALGFALLLPARYTATASFMPQAPDPNSGLRSLAGQFGIQVGGSAVNQSPDFYAGLVEAKVILAPIAADSFDVVEERVTTKRAFADLVNATGTTYAEQTELATDRLRDLVEATIDKKTGVLSLKVTTRWRSVSVAIAERILTGLNDFNLKTRQSQASEERKFAEGRLLHAEVELRASENRLQAFLERNRQTVSSPQLTFEKDRLQRDVSLHQQVVVSLAQALEDARLREVRDTPVITIVQPPSANSRADPGGRVMLVLLGLLSGGAAAVLLALLLDGADLARAQREPGAKSFQAALARTLEDLRAMIGRKSRDGSAAE